MRRVAHRRGRKLNRSLPVRERLSRTNRFPSRPALPVMTTLTGPVAPVPADEDELGALEEVGQDARIDLARVDALELDGQVGQEGRGDLLVEARQGHFEVLRLPDVDRRAAMVRGEPVEELGVDVVADAEDEDPGAQLVRLLDVPQDVRRLRRADGRQAVRQEEDVARPLAVPHAGEGGEEGVVDVRAAGILDAVDELEGPADGVARRRDEAFRERP